MFVEESDEEDEPPSRRRRMAERAAEGGDAEDEVIFYESRFTSEGYDSIISLSFHDTKIITKMLHHTVVLRTQRIRLYRLDSV